MVVWLLVPITPAEDCLFLLGFEGKAGRGVIAALSNSSLELPTPVDRESLRGALGEFGALLCPDTREEPRRSRLDDGVGGKDLSAPFPVAVSMVA